MSESPAPSPKRVWRRRLIELGVFLLALYGVHLWQTRDTAEGRAPSLTGTDLNGQPLTLEGPVLVHFWATWCGVCDAMDDNVAAVAADHRVITVAVRSEGAPAIRQHLEAEGLTDAFPVIADPDGTLARRWGVSAFPTTFAVDAEGTIRSTSVGYTTTPGLRARLALAE